MSSTQQTLGDIQQPEPQTDEKNDEGAQKPQWTPGDQSASNECLYCGSHVSAAFARCHGDREGRVHRCTECAPQNKLKWLAAGIEPRRGGGVVGN